VDRSEQEAGVSLFEARSLTYRAEGLALVNKASFALESHTLTALVGPNGAGKTTLMRLGLGLLSPDSGTAFLDGADVASLAPAERARKAAYLPQQRPMVWPQPVRDVVALGRFAYGGLPGHLSAEDRDAVEHAMAVCDLESFEHREADTLSGGELARVHLARTLAAQTPVLFADEPVAALDPLYRHQVLRIFAKAAREGRCVLTVVHDLALAARYADRLIWMQEGEIVADGSPVDTITPERMRAVFGVEARVEPAPERGVSLDILGPVDA
jgi:iron complex transport system ATP-binding protein